MNINNLCRCCLAEGDITSLQSIWNNTEMTGSTETLGNVLSNYLSIQVQPDDGYPEKICERCIFRLHGIVTFTDIVGNSKIIVESYINENVDIETDIKVDSRPEDNDFLVKTDQIFFCLACDSTFLESKELSAHCLEIHKREDSSGRLCKYCYERFNNLKALENHKQKHLTPFICNSCNEGFTNSIDLDHHLEISSTCSKYLQKIADKPANNSIPPKKVICHHCGKSYVSSYIAVHMLIHGDEFKFKCTLCQKSFKTKNSLISHLKCIHKKEKNHKCLICEESFVTSSKRSSHMKIVHFKDRNQIIQTL